MSRSHIRAHIHSSKVDMNLVVSDVPYSVKQAHSLRSPYNFSLHMVPLTFSHLLVGNHGVIFWQNLFAICFAVVYHLLTCIAPVSGCGCVKLMYKLLEVPSTHGT